VNALELKLKILRKKAKEEPSFIVRNILNNEVKQLRSKIKKLKD